MKPILFPGLGLSLDINNVAFNIFGKDIVSSKNYLMYINVQYDVI